MLVRFGVFEIDTETAILSRAGQTVRLQEQPARLLAILVGRHGQVVTREELRSAIWPADTFVQFDTSLNTAVKKVRQALKDDSDNPLFVETVPRKGYRFIAPVIVEGGEVEAPPVAVVKRPWQYAWIALAVGLLLGSGWLLYPRLKTNSLEPARLSIPLPIGTRSKVFFGPTVSIDAAGKRVAFIVSDGAKQSRVWSRMLNSSESKPVRFTDGAEYVRLSPDGTSMLLKQGGMLKRLDANGNPPMELARTGLHIPHAAVWGEDGFVYYTAPDPSNPGQRPAAVWRVPEGGGKGELLAYTERPELGAEWMVVLEALGRGRLLISTFRSNMRTIEVLDIATRRREPLYRFGSGGFLTPANWLVFHEGLSLKAVRAQLDPPQTTGAPISLLSGVESASWSGGNLAVSKSGTLVYVPAAKLIGDRVLVSVDFKGKETKLNVPPGPYEISDLSPDGKYLIVRRYDASEGSWTLLATPLGGGEWVEIERGLTGSPMGLWVGDSRQVVFQSTKGSVCIRQLYPLGPVRTLTQGNHFRQEPQAVDAQNRLAWFAEGYHPRVGVLTQAVHLDSGKIQAQRIEKEGLPAIRPDGKWLLTATEDEIFLRPYGNLKQAPIRVALGTAPRWTPDGKQILYRVGSKVFAVPVTEGNPPRLGEARLLFEGDYQLDDKWTRQYVITPDGKHLLFSKRDRVSEETRELNVILNWYGELEKLIR